MAIMATPTASAAVDGDDPHSAKTARPTKVEIRWPPINARGCAGSAFGDPNTVTIEVANGINTNGNAVSMDKNTIVATATAPPIAPAIKTKIRSHLLKVRSPIVILILVDPRTISHKN